MAPHEMLKEVLLHRVGFEVVSESVKDNQVRFFGRVRPMHMPGWLGVMTSLLKHSAQAPWSIDISRQYFLRGDKLMFGWRVILQGADIAEYLPEVTKSIQGVPRPTLELDEVPLHANPNRNALRNGRGAQLTDTAVVGPQARAQMGM